MDLYLTPETKEYYLNALKEVENSEHDFWKVEKGISTYLKKINENKNIQTLYSKGAGNCQDLSSESYLIIAYSKKVELRIFRELLPYFIYYYNDHESSCFYSFNGPGTKENNYEEARSLKLKCVDDPNYFNINHIRIELKEGSLNLHQEFWIELTEKLTEL